MKSDQYLSRCLEQAALSPLHYRHGCIIVKGGKVIGQGFNDYRPGYDGGGTLKTGCLSQQPTRANLPLPPTTKPGFHPFETAAGHTGSRGAAALSMRSEMMAIQRALATTSRTMAKELVLGQKPGGGLPGDDKWKREQRRLAVREYVEAVVFAAQGQRVQQVQQQVQQGAGLGQTVCRKNHQNQKEKRCGKEDQKHRKKRKHKRKTGSSKGQHMGQCENNNRSMPAAQTGWTSTSAAENAADYDDDDDTTSSVRNLSAGHSKHPKKTKDMGHSPVNNHLVIPTGCSGQPSQGVRNRTKHPRLVGADLYVARLGKPTTANTEVSARTATISTATATVGIAINDMGAVADPGRSLSPSLSTTPSSSSAGCCLHDELICKQPRLSPRNTPERLTGEGSPDGHTVSQSNPCYRCVSYMHHVGIKRVFWTNSEGQWEMAKVRDLVDLLEGSGAAGGDGLDDGKLFVTKHEVLKVLRTFDGGG